MSTNYYWHREPICPRCHRSFDATHIGKSSGGWCFGLHVGNDIGIHSLDDWRRQWKIDGSSITNEYDELIPEREMLHIITQRDGANDAAPPTDEWLAANHAARGPRGLARHAIDDVYCFGHGEGTWDLIGGEFS